MRKNTASAATVVAVSFLLGMVSRGTGETFTVFLLPLDRELGWDRASLTAIYSLMLLGSGLAAPLAGVLFDRLGPRRLYLLGALMLGGATFTASIAETRWQFYLGFSLPLGFAGAALGNVPHVALLSRWFTRRLGSVTGLVYSAMGVGPMLMVPLAQFLIDSGGWRQAYQWLAGGITAVLLAVLLLAPWGRLAAGDPESGTAPRFARASEDFEAWTLGGAVRSIPFWGLCWTYFFTALGGFAVVVQLVAYLVASGFSPLVAATAFGFIGSLMPIGMIGSGLVSDRASLRGTLAVTYTLTLSGIVVLFLLGSAPSPWLLVVLVGCLGLSMGSRGPVVSTIASRLFRGRQVGSILGVITLAGGLGGALGSWASGLLYDLTGGYTAMLAFAFFFVALGSTPFWFVPALARRR